MPVVGLLLLLPIAQEVKGQSQNIQRLTRDEGLPQSQILAFHQDRRGFVWAGTYGGAARLGGGFTYILTTGEGLTSNVVTAFAEGEDGTLWMGTLGGGICSHSGRLVSCFGVENGLPSNTIRALLLEGDTLWAATDGGVVRIVDGVPEPIPVAPDITLSFPFSLARTADGTLWMGTRGALTRLQEGEFRAVRGPGDRYGGVSWILPTGNRLLVIRERGIFLREGDRADPIPLPGLPPEALLHHATSGEDGAFWVAGTHGLLHLAPPFPSDSGPPFVVELVTTAHGLPRDEMTRVMVDREGTVWMGTDDGITKLLPGPFRGFSIDEGLPNPFARALAVDGDERLWVGTRSGAARWSLAAGRFETVVPGSWFPDPRIYALAPPPEGGMLVGSRSGLLHWDGGRYRLYTEEDGLPSDFVLSLLSDGDTGVWIGTDRGVAHWDGGTITPFPDDHPLSGVFVISLEMDEEARLWVGLAAGGIRILDGDSVQLLDASTGLTDQVIWALRRDAAGAIWIASNGDGAFRVSSEGILRITEADGLQDPFVWQVLPDSRGDVWFYTSNGLYRYRGDQLHHFGAAHGLIDSEGAAGAALEDPAGRLWFGTGRGVQSFFPHLERRNLTPPPVEVMGVTLGTEAIEPGDRFLSSDAPLQIQFGALSFRAPSAIRYRYRLLRGDQATGPWSSPATTTSVTFLGLSPGRYTFQVEATNEDGVVSSAPGTFTFTVDPRIWQTWWARFGLVLALMALTALLVRRHLRRGEEERRRLQDLVRERENRLQEIVEHSTIVFYSHDTGHNITYISPQVEAMLGVPAHEAPQRWTEFATDNPLNAAGEEITETAFRTGERQPPYELELRHIDGRLVRVQVTESPVVKNGSVVGMVGSLTDITGVREAEAHRRELEERLQTAQRMEAVGRLAGGVAHDFNNLLTTILGHTSLMALELPSGHHLQSDLQEVQEACSRAASLVSQLLAFGRKQMIRPTHRNLDLDVQSTVAMLRRMLGQNILLETVSSQQEPWVLMDRSQVDQILLNLAVNARDAMPHGGTLTVATALVTLDRIPRRWSDPDMPTGTYVLLRVSDTGAGMSPETVAQVFEPFFTTKGIGEGSGLGLATVWGIVKQSGGHVEVQSELGTGTIFEIYLPYHPPPPKAAE